MQTNEEKMLKHAAKLAAVMTDHGTRKISVRLDFGDNYHVVLEATIIEKLPWGDGEEYD